MLTVFTPTYNRCNLLPRLYESLKSQTSKDFEWLIVDDGSVDDTKNVIEQWKKENTISINYIYQENGGKPSAVNNGVKNAKGELFFCVDSDDYLPENAVEKALSIKERIRNNNVAGIIAQKIDTSGKLLGDKMPNGIEFSTCYDLNYVHSSFGERTLIYKTDVLRKYPYPIISGEKFIGECVVYDKIDLEYTMFLFDEVLTICEYQEGGLTDNIVKTMIKNPTGYKIYHAQRIDIVKNFKARLGHIIRYNTFKKLSTDKKYNYSGKYKLVVKLLSPMGYLGKLYYKRK